MKLKTSRHQVWGCRVKNIYRYMQPHQYHERITDLFLVLLPNGVLRSALFYLVAMSFGHHLLTVTWLKRILLVYFLWIVNRSTPVVFSFKRRQLDHRSIYIYDFEEYIRRSKRFVQRYFCLDLVLC